MISEQAVRKVKILMFWEKHGLTAAMEAFSVHRRTLYGWRQKFKKAGIKGLNNRSRAPRRRRNRQWPYQVLEEIRHLRELHPNLGKDKLYLPLARFCEQNQFACPKPSTIGRLVKDCGGLRSRPIKPSCAGRRQIKREKVLRKPKDLEAEYPGHVVALDTIERFVAGCRRYVITFEDIYTRFAFAWGTTSHASLAAKEFFDYCRMVFPYPFTFVLTDNGSEFKKHFATELKRLNRVHYHTYPKTPKMNAHCERFNRTIQEEFIDFHVHSLVHPVDFNQRLMEWLIWYNTERPHFAFKNLLSPLQFLLSSYPP
jgi:transposase InsO family protein